MFWTVRLPDDSVALDLHRGRAELEVRDRRLLDYGKNPNALALGDSVPATASYRVSWRGPVTRRVRVRDQDNGFTGEYVENAAALEWSAEREGFRFVSDPAETAMIVFAELGRERNGAYFR